jgi:hypothetical protein
LSARRVAVLLVKRGAGPLVFICQGGSLDHRD